MFGLGPATRIYLAAGVTDMRKGFEGLFGLVGNRLSCEPLRPACRGDRVRLDSSNRGLQTATAGLGLGKVLGCRKKPIARTAPAARFDPLARQVTV